VKEEMAIRDRHTSLDLSLSSPVRSDVTSSLLSLSTLLHIFATMLSPDNLSLSLKRHREFKCIFPLVICYMATQALMKSGGFISRYKDVIRLANRYHLDLYQEVRRKVVQNARVGNGRERVADARG
jgi:hypothetical protein